MRYKCSLLEYLTSVCERKNKEELENWRSFYIKRLAPLDKQAQELVKNNAYLIENDECHGKHF
jgi:hypothetical protein